MARLDRWPNRPGYDFIGCAYSGVLSMIGDLGRPLFLSTLAEVCVETGRFDDGLTAIAEALAAADENDDHEFESERNRLKGELVLRKDSSNEVEVRSCYERAIEIARKQSAKSLELRAAMSLSRLLAKQGKRDEARAMLAEIYGWFTEGFDTVTSRTQRRCSRS